MTPETRAAIWGTNAARNAEAAAALAEPDPDLAEERRVIAEAQGAGA